MRLLRRVGQALIVWPLALLAAVAAVALIVLLVGGLSLIIDPAGAQWWASPWAERP